MRRMYKTYSLEALYEMLDLCERELSSYDMMNYDFQEGLAIASLNSEREAILSEIKWKETKEGIMI